MDISQEDIHMANKHMKKMHIIIQREMKVKTTDSNTLHLLGLADNK